jgi:hypothetical protein
MDAIMPITFVKSERLRRSGWGATAGVRKEHNQIDTNARPVLITDIVTGQRVHGKLSA